MSDDELKKFLEEYPDAKNFEVFPKVSKYLFMLYQFDQSCNKDETVSKM